MIKEASKLGPLERMELVPSLLGNLDASPHHVSDEDALKRLEDLKSGKVKGLSKTDFWVLWSLNVGMNVKLQFYEK